MAPTPQSFADLAPGLHARVLDLVRAKGHRRLPEPVRLASGQLSDHFVDGKAALAHGDDLALGCEAMLAAAGALGVEFDAAGGLTLGADHFAHGVALLGRKRWFVVRKAPKGRGTNRLLEGAALGDGTRVLLVDDVVTTGGSIQAAFRAVVEAGARVVLASTLVDRGEAAARFFAGEGVPYVPLLTYRDLGIPPVEPTAGAGATPAAAAED